jgi:uncharacterized membrane-anchored protein YitT (DUF2179 family)
MSEENHPQAHRFYEDVLAILFATMIVALGIAIFSKATLAVGGAAGLALLLQYATPFSFGTLFFVINLPFYVLGFVRMGWKATLRTFIAVLLVSVFSKVTPVWIPLGDPHPVYAAIMGGVLMGLGLLMLFRHRTGLGGVNILALYLQERYGLRAGYFQLILDGLIMLGACFVIDLDKVALSTLGAAILNFILAINHRPGRYTAVS